MEYSNVGDIAREGQESGKKHHKASPLSTTKINMVRPLPAGKDPTDPKGLYMLSNLDQIVPYIIEVIVAYKNTRYHKVEVDACMILKESLGKVLEEYYPLVGRVELGSDGKMVVDCDGGEGGVPFGEAFFDEEMAVAVGDIVMVDRKVARKLVYHTHKPYETILDVPPLAIQVTRYRCGGMILGVRFNHVMFDGIGFADFMKSWSGIARGFPLPIRPHLDRSILSPRTPPKIYFPHHEFLEGPLTPILIPNPLLVTKSFCFTPTMLSRLRELVMQNNNNKNEPVSRAPTNFELISALTWIYCTMAKKVGPEEISQLCTAVDGRHKLQPPIPKGYFGNGITWSCARSRAQDLTSQPLTYVVGIVHNAIRTVTKDHIKSTIDFHEVTRKPLGMVNTMYITKWNRLPIYEIDFGWGVASQVAPGAILENLIIYLSHEKDSKNVVISLSLLVDAMDIFQELIIEFESQLMKDN
ncbi:hypothetical protein ACS0TY_029531 [Phlomoides rotata]